MNVPEREARYHSRVDPHRHGSALADVILGGQDGLVNVLGVVLGVAAATANARIVLAAGLASTFAGVVSMAAVAYSSRLAESALYESERQREYRHVRAVPTLERSEVRAMYARKGFDGNLLDRIVETITANEDVWVAVMMSEEHKLAPIGRRDSLRGALVVGAACLVGSLVPLTPFLVLPTRAATWLAVISAALVLFGVGAYKAHVTVGSPMRNGIEMALIGTASALAGYAVGALMRVPLSL
ncbi:MAG: VIT1/CCC1 transporter family protein [Polyangiaceae bacterium]|jgi:vacuolar iron transporter family protein